MSDGFYKVDDTILLFGPNFVLNQKYELLRADHTRYEYPVDGWYWFDSEEEARTFFNLPPKEPTKPSELPRRLKLETNN